jgi:hypothetical protein
MAGITKYPMGLAWSAAACCLKRKFRFLFEISDITSIYNGTPNFGDVSKMMPPERAARPSLSIKEIDAVHLNETIYYPGRPEWKPLQVTLFDVMRTNPIWDWLSKFYDPNTGAYKISSNGIHNLKKVARVYILDGQGNECERWLYYGAFPTEIEFGELDMTDPDMVKVTLTLRYDRAVVSYNGEPAFGS